jgi:hypothetical protein
MTQSLTPEKYGRRFEYCQYRGVFLNVSQLYTAAVRVYFALWIYFEGMINNYIAQFIFVVITF